MRRQGEDDMDVGRGEQFTATSLEPAFASAGLTLRTVPITAAVIRDSGTMSAAGALIDMTAECSGAAARDGPQDLDMGPTDPVAVALDESCSCAADQVEPYNSKSPEYLELAEHPGVHAISERIRTLETIMKQVVVQ